MRKRAQQILYQRSDTTEKERGDGAKGGGITSKCDNVTVQEKLISRFDYLLKEERYSGCTGAEDNEAIFLGGAS